MFVEASRQKIAERTGVGDRPWQAAMVLFIPVTLVFRIIPIPIPLYFYLLAIVVTFIGGFVHRQWQRQQANKIAKHTFIQLSQSGLTIESQHISQKILTWERIEQVEYSVAEQVIFLHSDHDRIYPIYDVYDIEFAQLWSEIFKLWEDSRK